jgi:hypothetical protein
MCIRRIHGLLNRDGDAVRACVAALLGSIHNDRSKHNTDSDAELVACDECATDGLRTLGNLSVL